MTKRTKKDETSIRIASNLALPLDFATERLAFIARTGAGKSGGMRVFFEQYLEAGQFCVFIDPKGDAWGIRAAGKRPGYPVLVMGGDHADVPLQPSAGAVVAEFLVRERISTVLDVSDFSNADMVRFVTALTSTLYRRNRDVMHVFIDETDMVAGEKFYNPDCLHAIQLIQNKGRHRGFGVTVATQRSAMINKSVLFASGTLVAMQTTAPRDIKVVKEWLDVCGTPGATQEIIRALPELKTREAFVYSPQKLGPVPQRITFAEFRTFDSMRTPRPGEVRQKPKGIADVDLAAVKKDMARTIEECAANDPIELKKQIAALKKELVATKIAKSNGRAEVASKPKPPKEVPVLRPKEVERLEKVAANLRTVAASIVDRLPKAIASNGAAQPRGRAERVSTSNERTIAASASCPAPSAKGIALPKGERITLTAVAQHRDGVTREHLTILTSYKRSSRDAYIQRLREKGLVALDAIAEGLISATASGESALGTDFKLLPTGDELREHLLEDLPKGESAVLRVLVEHYPSEVSREAISEATEYKRSSRDAYLQRLSTRKLVTEKRDGFVAADELFG